MLPPAGPSVAMSKPDTYLQAAHDIGGETFKHCPDGVAFLLDTGFIWHLEYKYIPPAFAKYASWGPIPSRSSGPNSS